LYKPDYQVWASTGESGLADVTAPIVNRIHIQLSNRSGRYRPSDPDMLGLTAHGTEVTEAYRQSRAHCVRSGRAHESRFRSNWRM